MYVKEFKGFPTTENFQLVEEELEALKDDNVIIKALYLSVDPYMRAFMLRFQPPEQMVGGQIAE
jgi:NADPH-dependent curcumin reductase CurA